MTSARSLVLLTFAGFVATATLDSLPARAEAKRGSSKSSEPAAAAKPPAGGGEDEIQAKLSDTSLGHAVALIGSDPRKAAGRFDDLEKEIPYLDDVLQYYEAVARGRYDHVAGRRALESFLKEHPDSIVYGDAAAELARLVEADGDADRAIELADRHGRNAPDGAAASSVCYAAGRLLARRDPAKAYVYLQCARAKAPLSSSARGAYEMLTVLRSEQPSLRPSDAAGLMAEARLLGREGRGAEQVAMLRELLTKYPGSPSEGEAELAYGRGLGRTESKAAGGDWFARRAAAATGTRKAKLLYEGATLRWNDDRNDEARAMFEEMLALKTGIGDEQQALYALARISDAQGRRSDAIAYFGKAAALARGAVRADSEWRRGWVSYKAKDFETSRKSFAQMAAAAPRGSDTDGRPEALYWEGRSIERLGDKEEAFKRYAVVLDEFPQGYYAAAAERRLGRKRTAPIEVRTLEAPASLPAAASLAIRRAKTLREAGLLTLAARDLAARLKSFDAATRRAVLPALPSSGAYDAAFRIAIEMSDNGQLTKEEARTYFYPRAHADIVEREAKKAGIDPVLVYALMRQESAFSATAVSSAKALGLMQLLEKTAKRVAASSGLPEPEAEDLFDPATNIRLGVRYLAELSRLFDGNTALMAAAYNAGETAAEKWRGLARSYDEDEMIEQISYRETRAYVKAILRNMRNYRSIYSQGAASGV
jgi:soluble lytic murein transglycosylase